jgi:hypothetical protein
MFVWQGSAHVLQYSKVRGDFSFIYLHRKFHENMCHNPDIIR